MLYARALGRAVKLLGMAELVDGKGWRASVAPAMVAEAHPLANVSDVFNAVMVHGDRVDDVMFYGRGAGTARRRARCAGRTGHRALPGQARARAGRERSCGAAVV